MSLFAEAFAVGASAMDAVYGEEVRVEPKLATTGSQILAAADDSAVPPFTAVAIVDDGAAVNRTPQPSARSSQPPDIVVAQTTADFDAAQFTAATMPRKGWSMVLMSRAGLPRYGINVARTDGTGRLICTLEPHGRTA